MIHASKVWIGKEPGMSALRSPRAILRRKLLSEPRNPLSSQPHTQTCSCTQISDPSSQSAWLGVLLIHLVQRQAVAAWVRLTVANWANVGILFLGSFASSNVLEGWGPTAGINLTPSHQLKFPAYGSPTFDFFQIDPVQLAGLLWFLKYW